MKYYVSKKANQDGNGSFQNPFLTIQQAADVAKSGDVITVREGIYRECVIPRRGGNDKEERIIYQAMKGERVIIKGSERIQNWVCYEKKVWTTKISNSFFGDFNPYTVTIEGDWLVEPLKEKIHVGEIYLNGNSLYEVQTLEDVINPKERKEYYFWKGENREKRRQIKTNLLPWYTENNGRETILYADFGEKNPNEEMVEINVRKSCFFSEKINLNYITVRGFEMEQAATIWAPPTSNQIGMLGVNWAKGWIIEDNVLHDSKCSAISLGRCGVTGDQLAYKTKRKSGYQYQLEAVFEGIRNGWKKEKIGGHIVRNNIIYDCGQNGIVGNMGCAFSKIYNNHLYNIGIKHEFFGWEIAGIKFHAPIDVQIFHNRINNCSLGIWMDWQAQNTRISRNIFYDNDRDATLEVTHGPLLIDNNMFLSEYGFDNHAQGTAFINNLICGRMYCQKILDRATPYHVPHTTEVAGYAFVYGGDERIYNNIYIGNRKIEIDESFYGTKGYDKNPSSYEAYIDEIKKEVVRDQEIYQEVEQPVYIKNNVYWNGAESYKKEEEKLLQKEFDPALIVYEKEEKVYLKWKISKELLHFWCQNVNTEKLGKPRITEAAYETPEGNEIKFDKDFFGNRKEKRLPGPFLNLKEGENILCIWQ